MHLLTHKHGLKFALAVSYLLVVAAAFGQPALVSVKQNSIPEALVPLTKDLLLTKPVTDGDVKLELFRLQGEGVEWSPDGKLVVYDCKHKDGYYNIHVCRPDGTDDRCLTTLDNGLPHRHAGTPSWQASGKYIAFAAEKQEHPGGSIEAIPGFGGHSDVWVMRADGSKAWQLTQTSNTKDDGVIIPKFSRDGTKLSWTERVGAPKILQRRSMFGDWVLKVADFEETTNGPQLAMSAHFSRADAAFTRAMDFRPTAGNLFSAAIMKVATPGLRKFMSLTPPTAATCGA